MKLISFVVPCYNSEEYMKRCIDSLLIAKDDIEIIIVNDGSKDNTIKIANEYKKAYPKTIKVIDKENGGHGSGINEGLKVASGKYFKVVDSDDWVDEKALKRLIQNIKKNKDVDLYIVNYTYNHLDDGYTKTMNFKNVFEENKILSWNDTKHFAIPQHIIMHTLVYKTKILKDCKLTLPKHTFYVDNIVAYKPLPYVKTLCYLNIDFYQYYIGREDQSVNEKVMISRIDQQIKVTKLLIDTDIKEVKEKEPKLYKYMVKMVAIMLAICNVYIIMNKDKDSIEDRNGLKDYLKTKNPTLYNGVKHHPLVLLTTIPTKPGSHLTVSLYKLAQKIYKFN